MTIKLTWLGTAAYILDLDGIKLMFDPFFFRQLNEKANLVIATEDKSKNSNYLLVAFTGYIDVRCLNSVNPGDYIVASQWKGIGSTGTVSTGTSGFKRLLAVQSFDYIESISKPDINTEEESSKKKEELPIPGVIKLKDFGPFLRKINKEDRLYLKNMYKLENMQRVLKTDIGKKDIAKIKKLFDDNGFTYDVVEKKEKKSEEVKVKRVLALLM